METPAAPPQNPFFETVPRSKWAHFNLRRSIRRRAVTLMNKWLPALSTATIDKIRSIPSVLFEHWAWSPSTAKVAPAPMPNPSFMATIRHKKLAWSHGMHQARVRKSQLASAAASEAFGDVISKHIESIASQGNLDIIASRLEQRDIAAQEKKEKKKQRRYFSRFWARDVTTKIFDVLLHRSPVIPVAQSGCIIDRPIYKGPVLDHSSLRHMRDLLQRKSVRDQAADQRKKNKTKEERAEEVLNARDKRNPIQYDLPQAQSGASDKLAHMAAGGATVAAILAIKTLIMKANGIRKAVGGAIAAAAQVSGKASKALDGINVLIKGFTGIGDVLRKSVMGSLWSIPMVAICFVVTCKSPLPVRLLVSAALGAVLGGQLWNHVHDLFVTPTDIPEAQSGGFDLMSKIIATVAAFSVFKGKMRGDRISELIKRISLLPRLKDGVEELSKWVVSAFQAVVNFFGSFFGAPKIKMMNEVHAIFNKWVKDVDVDCKHLGTCKPPTPEFIRSCIDHLIIGYGLKDQYRGHPVCKSIQEHIMRLQHAVTPYKGIMQSSNNFRFEPALVMIHGKPGIGKTLLMQHFCLTAMIKSGMLPPGTSAADASAHIWQKGVSKYWNGYTGQKTLVMDDAFQQRADSANEENEYMQIIRMVGTWAYALNFADLESKGNIYFNSQLIVGTTNLRNLRSEAAIALNEPEAVIRRITHGVTLQLRPEYACDGMLDYVKYEAELVACRGRVGMDAFPWYIWNVQKLDFSTGTLLGEPYPLKDALCNLIDDLKRRQIAHTVARSHLDTYTEALRADMVPDIPVAQAGSEMPVFYGPVTKFEHDTLNEIRCLVRDHAVGNNFDGHTSREFMRWLRNMYFTRQLTKKEVLVVRSLVDARMRARDGSDEEEVALALLELGARPVAQSGSVGMEDERKLRDLKVWCDRQRNAYCGQVDERADQLWWLDKMKGAGHLEQWEYDLAISRVTLRSKESMKYKVADILRSAYQAHMQDVADAKTAKGFFNRPKAKLLLTGIAITASVGVLVSMLGGVVRSLLQLLCLPVTVLKGAFSMARGKKKSKKEENAVAQSNTPQRKPAWYKGNAAQAQSATVAISRNAYANTYKATYTELDQFRLLGQIMFVNDCMAVEPHHYARDLKVCVEKGLASPTDIITFTHCEQQEFTFTITLGKYLGFKRVCHPERDVAFVKFEGVRAHKNIETNFIRDADIKCLKGRNMRLDIYNTLPSRAKYGQLMTHVVSKPVPGVDLTMESRFGYNKLERYVKYDCTTYGGDCGAPLSLLDASCFSGRGVVGVHVAGLTEQELGYATIVTQEMIVNARKLLATANDLFPEDLEERVAISQSGGPLPFSRPGSFLGICSVRDPVRLNPKSQLIPVKEVFGKFGESDDRPAPLSKVFREGVWVNPMEVALRGYATDVLHYEQPWLGQAIYLAFMKVFENTGRDSRRLYSFEEAVKGSPPDKLRAIPRGTSAGYPYVLEVRDGKKEFFGFEDEIVLTTDMAMKLRVRVEHVLDQAALGNRLSHVFMDCLKDELRSAKKVEAAETRLLSASPLDYLVCFRMMFGSFITACNRNHTKIGMCPGINPYTDWGPLRDVLRQKGTVVFDGDFKSFDKSEMPTVLEKFVDHINRWYDDAPGDGGSGERNNLIRRILWLELVHSRHIGGLGTDQTFIYQWNKSLPSGHPCTTLANSLYALFCLIVAYISATKDMTGFWDHVAALTYGDDNIVAPDITVRSVYNQITVAEHLLRELKMVYTPGNKGGSWEAFFAIEGATFLKRGFTRENGRWLAPLNLDSIRTMAYWCKGLKNLDRDLKAKYESMLMELSMHPQEVWDEFVPTLRSLMQERSYQPMADLCRSEYRLLVSSSEDFWF